MISNNEWEIILRKYEQRCLCCGLSGVPLTKDHVIPLTKNGEDIPENIQPLCGPCNSKKGDEIIDYRGSLKFTGRKRNQDWYPIRHAANLLEKSPSTIKKWIRENTIAHITAADGRKYVWIKDRLLKKKNRQSTKEIDFDVYC